MQCLIGNSSNLNVNSRFILQFAQSLANLKSASVKRRRVILGLRNIDRSVNLSDPTLTVEGDCLRFEFVATDALSSSFKKSNYELNLRFNFQDLALLLSETRHKGKPTTVRVGHTCECSSVSHVLMCEHLNAAVAHLNSKVRGQSVEQVQQWLNATFANGQALGDKLIEDLQTVVNKTKSNEVFRLQWRVSVPENARLSSVRTIECYLQKMKARGDGWTVGRKITSPLVTAPLAAFQHPDDYLIASLLETDEYAEPGDSRALILALEVLQHHPNFCWDVESQPPVTIQKCQATIEFKEHNGLFEPELMVDGNPFQGFEDLSDRQSAQFVILDVENLTVKYFELTADQLQCVRVIQRATRRGARLTPETTLAMTQVLSKADSTSSGLVALIPEKLSGPEVALPPKIELHLIPHSGGELEARLRIACEGLETPPTPGIGVSRVAAVTPAGVCQYVRDLTTEINNADLVANQLNMGQYSFDGPYTWFTEGLEQSLQLLTQCRAIGESELPVCWPVSKPMRMLGEITPQCLKVRLTSERDWFGLEGELCIEDLQIPLVELFAALRSGSRFVPLGDGGFATVSDDLRQRLAIMDDVSFPERSRLNVSRAAAGMIKEAIGADMVAEIDQRWQDAIERLTDKTKVPKKAPKELKATLRDYQLAGYKWLSQLSHWNLGGCLADDMGLGKTVQALGILLDRRQIGPALIIAPTSVGGNWLRETEKFAPSLKPLLYREHDRDQLIQNAGPGDLIIVSYQMLLRDGERFSSRTWGTLILDEAQYIKNFNTKTCATVRQLQADWSLALTGTPLENHLGELWSLMRVISPGLLGSWERFRERFADPIERGRDHQRLLSLGRVLRPFMLRRTKSEVLTELPPRTEIVHTVELSAEERKRYDAARLAALAELSSNNKGENDQQRRIRILSWLTRLRQLACHPQLVDPRWSKSSSKLDAMMEIIRELVEGNHRALVFSQFVQHLKLVRQSLDKDKIKYQYLDGSTTAAKRQAAVDAFQRGEGDLFLISLKAGGTGLNLTGADYVMHLDPWWNPAVEDQATDRAHRIGQTQAVTVFRLVAKDTIEEQILSLHASKRELIAGVLDGADRAAKLSTQELVDLIRLGLGS